MVNTHETENCARVYVYIKAAMYVLTQVCAYAYMHMCTRTQREKQNQQVQKKTGVELATAGPCLVRLFKSRGPIR